MSRIKQEYGAPANALGSMQQIRLYGIHRKINRLCDTEHRLDLADM